MNLSRGQKKLIESIKSLQRQRQALLKTLMRSNPLIVGSLCTVLGRCSNPYCHCAKEPSHKQTHLLFKYNGKRYCRFVRQKDEPELHKLWQEYKNFKNALNQIQAINLQEKQFLMAILRKRGSIVKKYI